MYIVMTERKFSPPSLSLPLSWILSNPFFGRIPPRDKRIVSPSKTPAVAAAYLRLNGLLRLIRRTYRYKGMVWVEKSQLNATLRRLGRPCKNSLSNPSVRKPHALNRDNFDLPESLTLR